jgi:hypothetical protein
MKEIGIIAELRILDGGCSVVDPCVAFVASGIALYLVTGEEEDCLVGTRSFTTPGTRDLPPETDEEEFGTWQLGETNNAIRCTVIEHVKRIVADHGEADQERVKEKRR